MKEAFKHISWFFKQNIKKYILCALLLLIVSIVPVFPTKFLGLAIDEIVNKTMTYSKLIYYVVMLMLLPISIYVINNFYHYTMSYLGHSLSFQLREDYIAHLFDLDSEVYEEYTKGDLIARASNDLQSLTMLATTFLQQAVYCLSLIISALVMMVIIHPILTLCSIAFMPIAIFFLNKSRIKKRKYYKQHYEIYAQMTENVLETIEGAKTIRAYGREDDDFKKTKIAIDNDVNSWWKILKFEAVYTPLFECVYLVAYTIAICLGSYYVIQGDITAGSLVTYLIYVGMLSSPLITLSTILNIVNNVGIADERYYEILNKKPKVYDEEDSKTIKTFKTIEFKDVTFRYSFEVEISII